MNAPGLPLSATPAARIRWVPQARRRSRINGCREPVTHEARLPAGEQVREVERQEEGCNGAHACTDQEEIHLPQPSIWPLIMGAGITFLLFGLVTNLVFSAVGVLLIVAALGGWIGESLHA